MIVFSARRRIRLLAAVLAIATGTAMLAGQPVSAAPPVASEIVVGETIAAAAVPVLEWTPCRDGFECATATVPLDYDRPAAAQIALSVIRLPAADPTRRIGSLFVNPGGPGGSGVDFVRGVGRWMPLELRGRFDLVGFDPRGVGRSTPLRCFTSLDEALSVLPPIPFPVGPEEAAMSRASDEALSAACTKRAGAILDHMSTANVARDMEQLRRAVGDDKLSYLGLSYGSFLGVTYANLFPDTVGALVVDGVLDPIAWSTGVDGQSTTTPFTTRLRSDAGSAATLGEFFRLCDEAGADCDFAGDSKARFEALAQRLLEEPLVSDDPALPPRFTYADLIAITVGALYSPSIWPDLAHLYFVLETATSATEVQHARQQVLTGLALAAQDPQEYPNFIEALPGVACSETDNPAEYDAWAEAADAAEERTRHFGALWTWFSSVCQPWPGQDNDRYAGPWTAATATPVLVVGNHFDPATPYHGATAVADLLPNSTLLTYQGWGHTAFGSGNYCAQNTIVQYLISSQSPAQDVICAPEGSPFGPLAAQRTSLSTSAIQAELIPSHVERAMRTD
jgi:pimeloyl-ACP methyl ester carboxylesterase